MSQFVLGTDYPCGMGHPTTIDHILRTPGLRNTERKAVLGGTAMKLLRIPNKQG